MSDFSERLKSAMEEKGISQSELSKITGIPKSAISQYLSKRFEPKDERLAILCKTLSVRESWLKGYDELKTRDELTDREKLLIGEYRARPELKKRIDALLYEASYGIFRAAKSDDGTVAPMHEEISGERLRRLIEAPETDEDL